MRHGWLLTMGLVSCGVMAQTSPYAKWEQARQAECDRAATGNAIEDMSRCATRKIERALANGLLQKAEVDSCLDQGRQRRGRGSAELGAWSVCGLQDKVRRALQPTTPAQADEPSLSQAQFTGARVLRLDIKPAVSSGPGLASRPWRRADIVSPLYAGRYLLMPNRGLDNLRYYAQAPQELERLCPDLRGVPDFVEALPYALSNVNETLGRTRSGDVSPSETAQIILLFGQIITTAGVDCDKVPDERRNACEAGRDPKNTVLPSLDAIHDMQALVGAHGCASTQVRRFTSNLAGYFRNLRLDGGATSGLPPPDTPAGAAYLQIFDQCARQAGGGSADRWCGCHVRQLHERLGSAPDALGKLDALTRDPFVDFSFGLRGDGIIEPPSHFDTGGRIAYPRLTPSGACAEHASTIAYWRADTVPRTTACLEQRSASVPDRCTYRAAWGSFSVDATPRCPELIDSRVWGSAEVRCTAGSAAAAQSPSQVDASGMRRFRHCPGHGYPCVTVLEIDREVPSGFLPPPPAFKSGELPVDLRIPRQKSPGSLIGLTIGVDETTLTMELIPMGNTRPEPELRAFRVDVYHLIAEDKALVLDCRYRDDKRRLYWYRSLPERVARRNFTLNVDYHPLLRIGPPRDWCPAAPGSFVELPAPPPAPAEPSRPTPAGRADPNRQAEKDRRHCDFLARAVEKARDADATRPNKATAKRLNQYEQKYAEDCPGGAPPGTAIR